MLNLVSPKRLDRWNRESTMHSDRVPTNSSLKPSKLKIYFATHDGSAVYGAEALKEKRTRYD